MTMEKMPGPRIRNQLRWAMEYFDPGINPIRIDPLILPTLNNT
jgi:hypothetical protein